MGCTKAVPACRRNRRDARNWAGGFFDAGNHQKKVGAVGSLEFGAPNRLIRTISTRPATVRAKKRR
jgi:hypothetical protein